MIPNMIITKNVQFKYESKLYRQKKIEGFRNGEREKEKGREKWINKGGR